MEYLKKALEFLDCATLTREEWLKVGMALKEEGYDVSTWNEWSKNDKRYHEGECERLWKGFNSCSNPIKGGSIIRLAESHGFKKESMEIIDPDGEIEFNQVKKESVGLKPTEQLFTYIDTLFSDDDFVGFVTFDVYENDEGKFVPRKGTFDMTAGEIKEKLKKYPDDIGASVFDYNKKAGAWIRFNALDGKGVKNENVKSFKYCLVESDDMTISEQLLKYERLNLPIAALVKSGNKSVHAICHVDASDQKEYKERVSFMYDYLEKNGVKVDRQNSNPSRLSRMPGVSRNGVMQELIGTNKGPKSYLDWLRFIENAEDDLPQVEYIDPFIRPNLKEEVISGLLRKGHKMLVAGPSKAGKSFLLMELAICLTEGKKWLGFECKRCKVLYVNLEIDPNSAINRFIDIYQAMGIKPEFSANLALWNLRGCALPLDKLLPKLIKRAKIGLCDVIIIDPIYKVLTGDENNASEMGAFCNLFDKVCKDVGCSVIYCHHHSKGIQGSKKAQDRASGSGVFARDPDALLDMVELEVDENMRVGTRHTGQTAWRIESSLREFKDFNPIDVWFNYPIHELDERNLLKDCYSRGNPKNNLKKSSKFTTKEDRKESIDTAYNFLCTLGQNGKEEVYLGDLAGYLEISTRCARDRVKELSSEYSIERGMITRKK